MWPLTQSFDFEGKKIAFDKIGDGPPLVLLHGTPFSAYVWRKIAPLLAADRTVYAFDLLGYGQSEKPIGTDVSLGIQNRVFCAFLTELGITSPDVIAHDFGGATALRAHLLDNIEYRKLMLIDPVAVRPWGSPFVQHVLKYEEAFAGLPDYIQASILKTYIRGAAFNFLSDEALQPYIAPWQGPSGQPAFYQQIAQMDQRYTDEIEPMLRRVRCPVSLLWGVDDQWIPISSGRALAEYLPDCTYAEIPSCGHLMQEDAPEAIVAAALRMLS